MERNLKFYNLMNYPVPQQSSIYSYITSTWEKAQESWLLSQDFSWTKKCDLMDEYIEYIDKLSWIFKYIPCIKQVYLCNSITFNALHKNSDIDICIISKHWYIRFARLFSWIVITALWLKRERWKFANNSKKFCLSFYIDEWYSDIYHIRKKQGDVYLSYWLAHSVLLYSDNTLSDNYLIEKNKKILSFLPNHPNEQSIHIWNKVIKETSYFKKIMEFILCNKAGKILQYIIKSIRWTIVKYKRSNLSFHTQKEIIISPYMLKFHQDKRDIIQNKRKNTTAKE